MHPPYWEVTRLFLDFRKSDAFRRVGRILVSSLLAIAEHMRLRPGSNFSAGVVGIDSPPPGHRVHG